MWPIPCTCADSCPKCHCCGCPRVKMVITLEPLSRSEQLDVPHNASLADVLRRLRLWLRDTDQAHLYCWVAYWGDPRYRVFRSMLGDPEQTVGSRLAELGFPLDLLPLRLCGIGLDPPTLLDVPALLMKTPLSRKPIPTRRELRRLDTAVWLGMGAGVFDSTGRSSIEEQCAIFRSCWCQVMHGSCASLGIGSLIGDLLVQTPSQLAQLTRCLDYAACCFAEVLSRTEAMATQLELVSGQRDLAAHLDLIDAPNFYQRVQQRVAPKAGKSVEALANWIGDRPKKKKSARRSPASKPQEAASCAQYDFSTPRRQLAPDARDALRAWSCSQLRSKTQK